MIALISANWLFFLIALVIGVATAFWTWAMSGQKDVSDHFNADDGLLDKAEDVGARPAVTAPPPAPEREAAPAPVVAEPEAPPAPPPAHAPEASVPPEPVAEPVPAPTPAMAPAPTPAPRPRKQPVVTETTPPPGGKPKIPPAIGEPDNLRLIKGVGPKLNKLLNNLGITRFDQIAEWKEEEIQEVDRYLESFSGRITRDSWIGQAKFLAKDDIAGFEQKYGKL